MSTSFEVIECQDKTEWLARRKEGIGASEAAAVLAVSPWKDAATVWGEKVGLLDAETDATEEMEWGLLLEDDVAEMYMRETDRLVVLPKAWTLSRSRQWPWMQATLDAEIVPIDERGPGLLQIKTAGFLKKADWSEEPPLHYLIQVQHELAVRGYAWGSLAVLFGGAHFEMLYADVPRNEHFIDALVKKEQAFWALVTSQTPPPLTGGGESVKELLTRLYPKQDAGKVIALPSEAVTWDQELIEVKEQLKKLVAREEELKNAFRVAIADAEVGVLPSGDSYSLKLIEKKEYVVKAQSYRELRRKAAKGPK